VSPTTPSRHTRRPAARLVSKAPGYSLIELVVVSAILAILASAILPLTRVTMQRQREVELRRALRELRTGIDQFKDAVDQGLIATTEISAGSEGYPQSLEQLVEGVPLANDASGRQLRFLRSIPVDPMTRSTEWGLRAVQDDPDARSWGGSNVFDVYTRSDATALDGSRYRDW